MSVYKQGDEVPSAGAAAAPAGAGQQSKQEEMREEKMRELKEKIEKLEKKISSDEDKADNMNNEAERVALRNTIAANTERLRRFEEDMRKLRKKSEQPAEQSTAAGGRSPTLCLPLRSRIGLPRRALRALLLLRELDSPFHLCVRTATRPPHVTLRGLCVRHLCVCITRLCASMVLRCRCPTGCVPPPTSSTPHVEQPTAARGRSPTLCQPLRSHIDLLASQGIARAPLATRICQPLPPVRTTPAPTFGLATMRRSLAAWP
jgi:hypothetical protein